MHSPDFCDACIEGLWISLMTPLALVDKVTKTAGQQGTTNVTLDLLPLAQFRDKPRSTESYSIRWLGANGSVLNEWTNKTSALISRSVGKVDVDIQFSTTQVRVDSAKVLQHRETIQL